MRARELTTDESLRLDVGNIKLPVKYLGSCIYDRRRLENRARAK